MEKIVWTQSFGSSGNLKSKPCPFDVLSAGSEPYRSIQNRKLVGIIAIVVAFATCGALAQAQQTGKFARIGFLDNSTASGGALFIDAFRQELSKLGWVEGKNVSIEYRFAEGKTDRLPELAAELVRLKVDLIVVAETPPALAAKKATTTIPILIANTSDPL
jgi:putative tryptophan/tyrosine transport system substrate-binding protein